MDWILLMAALVVSFLVFGFLVRVIKAAISTAITIAIIVLTLQIILGAGPTDLWQEILGLWQQLGQWITKQFGG